MRLISVSRRTDVAAFYVDWFMNRVRAGFVRWINPYSRSMHETSLRPEDVMAFVFCSKDYRPLLPHLDEFDDRDYRMLFHFTINGLPKALEPRVPDAAESVECARTLSRRYGTEAVLWRYDPIVISSITDRAYHLRRFGEMCEALEGSVSRCSFSFTSFYKKVQRNATVLQTETGVVLYDLPIEERVELAGRLADIASDHGIEMMSCCGDYLVGGKIKKGRCMDADLLCRLFPDRARRLRAAPTRQGCGCCACTDIGAYDTCPHGCVYCYANADAAAALRNHAGHDPLSDMLGAPATGALPPEPRKKESAVDPVLDLF